MPNVFVALGVKENCIMNRTISVGPAVCVSSLPSDFILEVCGSEDRIKDDLEVMTCGRVTMEVKGTGPLQDAVQFD